jgi:hypothetical protein
MPAPARAGTTAGTATLIHQERGTMPVYESETEIRLRHALQEIVRKHEKIMKDPPSWTTFTGPDDPRLVFAREAWFGAAQIARKALDPR